MPWLKLSNEEYAKCQTRKAIILLTDGRDHGSPMDEDALPNKLEESDVMVYSVYYATNMAAMLAKTARKARRRNGQRANAWHGSSRHPRRRWKRRRSERPSQRATQVLVRVKEERTKMQLNTWSRFPRPVPESFIKVRSRT